MATCRGDDDGDNADTGCVDVDDWGMFSHIHGSNSGSQALHVMSVLIYALIWSFHGPSMAFILSFYGLYMTLKLPHCWISLALQPR